MGVPQASLAAVMVFVVTVLGAVFAPGAQAATARAARAVRPSVAELRHCHADGQNPVVCVDLSAQRMWVMKGKAVVFAPVTVRTGRRGHVTRTGKFRIYWRHLHHWSTEYNSPMPYSQFFSGGEALHAIFGNIHRGPGSYGCVNLTLHDAARLWSVTRKGTAVEVWGRKPGT
ncbi:L,D-transpeptidase [Streptacidiphilus jiangxiensis]|uniref:L,D-transpeptidase catalytic domain n=1 Tax=Streptacidiphilus jiangxiensis TaxID=235985 RepID=A0A1H7J432_STRJI|nr:L,D-transpeptidase [Streptacidiphilus jiangxiensis]SEK67895.1 L,D-transpeptidase catalytic domain [Streptacidiphilus jiangxiensis]